jgi:phage-related protein
MARQITLELLADSSKFESGMKNAARAADVNGEKIEDAAKKADRMGDALRNAGEKADGSESKFMGLSDVASGMGDLFGIEALGPIAATGLALGDLTGGFAQLAPVMTGAIDKIKSLSVVTKLQSLAQGALNLIMSANPIFLVVAAVVALIAIFVVAYKNVEWFRDLVDGAFRLIKGAVEGAFNWVRDNWPLVLAILTGPIGLAVLAVTKHWDTIKEGFTKVKEWIGQKIGDVLGFFTGLPGKITAAASGMFDGISGAFKAMVNALAGIWNNTAGKLRFAVPSWVPGIGGKGFDMPTIPEWRALGGPVRAGMPYIVGEVGPELFVPNSGGTIVPNGAGGAITNIYVTALDPGGAATAVVRAIDEYEARNGTRYARA